jgi:hypothetical protein
MTEMIKDIAEAITDLNEEFYELTKRDDCEFITLNYYSMGLVAKFRDRIIWSTQDDERKFDEVKGEYEPFRQFLKRRVISYLKEEKKFLEKLIK